MDVPGERGRLEGEPDVGQELRQELHREGGEGLPHARLPLQVILASSIVMMASPCLSPERSEKNNNADFFKEVKQVKQLVP